MLESVSIRSLTNDVILFCIGFVIFSRVSAIIILDLLGFPFYMIEIFTPLLFIYGILYKSPIITIIKEESFKILLLLIFISLVVWYSTYFNFDGIRYVVSTGRGYFYIFLFYIIGKRMNTFNIRSFYLLALGAVFSGVLLVGINYVSSVEMPVIYLNYTAIFIVTIVTLLNSRYFFFIGLSSIVFYTGVYSGLRRTFFVYMVAVAIGVFIKTLNKESLYSKIILAGILIVFVLNADLLLGITEDILGNDYILYKRIVLKMEDVIYSGGAIGDYNRMYYINKIPEWMSGNLIPQGFLTKDPRIAHTGGLFMDLPMYELIHTFGSIITFIIIIMLMKYFFIWIILNKNKPMINYVIPAVFAMHVVYLFFDGSFLAWTYQSIIAGIVLGIISNPHVVCEYK